MIRLTNPDTLQYIIDQLEHGRYDYILDNCQLPVSCYPDKARLIVSTDGRFYTVYLDNPIDCVSNDQNLYDFCHNGSMTFLDVPGMLNFFNSLVQTSRQANRNMPYVNAADPNARYMPVFNPNAVDREQVKTMYQESQDTFVSPDKLAEEFKTGIYGQDDVIERFSEKLVIHMMRKQEKLLSAVFFGKTGTGKSSLAKALPQALSKFYHKEYGIIEIAGNELHDSASMTRFFGAPPEYVGHGKPTLFEPIKENPYMVVVINEIEKASDDLFTRLMECLDTSNVKLADNTEVDLKHCIFIFTSNLPIETTKFKSLTGQKQTEYLRNAFTKFCDKPEIAARIGSYFVFNDLDMDADMLILTRDIAQLLNDFGLRLEKIENELMIDLIRNKSAFGARAHMHTIEDTVGRYLIYHQELRNSQKSVVLKGTLDDLQIEAA